MLSVQFKYVSVTHFPRRMRNRAQNVTRSVSGTDDEVTIRKLKRQSSSDNSVISSYPLPEPDCDEDPIMVWMSDTLKLV